MELGGGNMFLHNSNSEEYVVPSDEWLNLFKKYENITKALDILKKLSGTLEMFDQDPLETKARINEAIEYINMSEK